MKLVAAFVCALACAGTASAAQRQVALPDPHVPLTRQPPLTGSTGPARLPRAGRTREVVRVGVDAAGRPIRVVVVQQIQLEGAGDYEFSVPAPVRDVTAPPGARAQPGLLDSAIVWQGFSPGRRDLVAVATLDRRAAAVLPLALHVDTTTSGDGFRVVLELRNRTERRVPSFTGRGDAAGLAALLETVRSDVQRGAMVTPPLITADVRPATVAVETPFAFRGEVTLPASARDVRAIGGRVAGSRVTFSGTVGGTAPSRVLVVVTGTGNVSPHVRVTASPVRSVARPPSGANGAVLLDTVVETMLGLARANQYETFLQTPSAPEQTTAAYVYATARVSVAAPAPKRVGGGGVPTPVMVAAVLLALGAAVVAWAHL